MNNLLSYCWLVDTRISASEKDLPVRYLFSQKKLIFWQQTNAVSNMLNLLIWKKTFFFYSIHYQFLFSLCNWFLQLQILELLICCHRLYLQLCKNLATTYLYGDNIIIYTYTYTTRYTYHTNIIQTGTMLKRHLHKTNVKIFTSVELQIKPQLLVVEIKNVKFTLLKIRKIQKVSMKIQTICFRNFLSFSTTTLLEYCGVNIKPTKENSALKIIFPHFFCA